MERSLSLFLPTSNWRESKMGKDRESFLPRQRPKSEWAHVSVTRDGARYVDVDELLERDEVKELVSRLKEELRVEEPRRERDGEHH